MPGVETIIAKGIANVGSAFLTNKMNRQNAYKTADYQNSINVRNWQAQNAYNSPSSQMARLRAAGLNPNLVYQSGVDNQAASIASPQVQNPTAEAPNFDFVGDYSQLGQLDNQTRQVDSVVDLNKAYENMQKTQEKLLAKEVPWRDKFLNQQFVSNQYQQLVTLSTANKLEAETGYTRRQIDNFYRSLENQFANDRVQRAVGLQNIKHAEALIDEINQKIVESSSRVKNLQLEYLRGDLARKLEQFTFEFQTSPSIHGGKSRMQDQWEATISETKQRVKKLEFENSDDFRYIQMFKGWNRSVEPSTRIIHHLIGIHNKYK